MNYELLAPAGNKESLLAAIAEGADAVYVGLDSFSARASAENFSVSDLDKLLAYAHFMGVKVYVALNTIVKESELGDYLDLVSEAVAAGADALILQDIFLAKLIKTHCPGATLHLSTQGGVNNVYGALVAKEYGFSRVILARETPIEEIRKITPIIETEVFVQGALCSSFSGQCYMSSFIGGLSGNRGKCKQPCRKEYTLNGEKKYAISLADLCVGERISELKEAGVSSFKIEGRMRRAEYVASAVGYYRGILDGTPEVKSKSRLKRTFNRGDYTSGLMFGQRKDFISSAVQGHIGEKIGTIISVNGNRITVKSSLNVHKGDGFKILREGKEVGSALAAEDSISAKSFVLRTRDKLIAGDSVHITTDSSLNKELLSLRAKRAVSVTFRAKLGMAATATAESSGHVVTCSTTAPLAIATGRALSAADVEEVFLKTDSYPYAPVIKSEIEGDLFAPRATMNALRRELYAALLSSFSARKERPLIPVDISTAKSALSDGLTVISEDFSFAPSAPPFAAVFAPEDYNDGAAFEAFFAHTEGRKRYLYIPAFLNHKDEEIISRTVGAFDGIYGENLAAIALAGQYNVPLIAGTGFNLFNSVDISGIGEVAASYAFSKELTAKEARALGDGAYFARGDIKVMDLIYCPYGKTCSDCRGKHRNLLTDYAGRPFTLRRYKLSDCRFELYNPQILVARCGGSLLYNLINRTPEEALDLLTKSDKELRSRPDITRGNSERGVK